MNRRKLATKRHRFIKRNSFVIRPNKRFIKNLKTDLKETKKTKKIIDNKLEELDSKNRFPTKQVEKEKKVMKLQKVMTDRRVKSLRELIDEEESKLDNIDKEEDLLDLLDELEDN